ncbi:MAG TPA: hypothetical protein VGB51_03905 [Actinomycetota bacterium]
MKRFLSPAFFAVAVVCFFLPFVSVSCNASALNDTFGAEGVEGVELPEGELEVKATGWEIVTNRPPDLDELGSSEALGGATEAAQQSDEDFPGRIFAILAIGAAVLGVGLSLLGGRRGSGAAVALGALGLLFLFLLRSSIQSRLGPAALFGVEVGYEPAYWAALGMFALAGGAGVYRLTSERPPLPEAPPGQPSEPPPGAAPPTEPPPPP